MSETMRACVLAAPGQMELREVPRPELGSRQVLVRVQSVGLCGTDFHIYSGEGNYNLDASGAPVPLSVHPQILGHEVTGVVVATGGRVEDLEPGQRVVVDQGLNCLSQGREELCEYCRTGDSHQCEHYAEHGITGVPGGLAEHLAIAAVNAVPIRTDLEPALAAMSEPLACVLHASETVSRASARYRLNDPDRDHRVGSVLVCGAGPAGNLFAQVLRRELGFEGLLLVSEPDAGKRRLIEGHDVETVDPTNEDLCAFVREKTGGRMIEYLIDASGSGPLFLDIPGLIRKQATILLYGHGHGGVGLEALNAVQWREPTLVSPCGASGSFEGDGRPWIYRRALEMIDDDVIQVAPIVTHRLPSLEAVPEAFAATCREPGYVKGVVVVD